MPPTRDEHRVAEPAEDVAEVVPDPLRRRSRRRCRRTPSTSEQHHPDGGDLEPERHARRRELDPLPGVAHRSVRAHCWVVRSRPYHCSDSAVSVPSSCISADDRVHRLVQRLRGRVRALVEAHRERLVEDRVADDLHRVAGVDVALGGGRPTVITASSAAVGEVLERRRVGVVAGDLGVVDDEVELEALDVEVLVEELLVGAAAADADLLAVEVGGQVADRRRRRPRPRRRPACSCTAR